MVGSTKGVLSSFQALCRSVGYNLKSGGKTICQIGSMRGDGNDYRISQIAKGVFTNRTKQLVHYIYDQSPSICMKYYIQQDICYRRKGSQSMEYVCEALRYKTVCALTTAKTIPNFAIFNFTRDFKFEKATEKLYTKIKNRFNNSYIYKSLHCSSGSSQDSRSVV